VKAPFSSRLANELGIGLAPRVEGTRRALTVSGAGPWPGISVNDVRQDKSQIAINSVGTSLSNGRGIFADQFSLSPTFFRPTVIPSVLPFPSTIVAQEQFTNLSPYLANSNNQQQNSQFINGGNGFFINEPFGSQFQNQLNRDVVFNPTIAPSVSPFGPFSPSFEGFGQLGQLGQLGPFGQFGQVSQLPTPWSLGSQLGQVNQLSPYLTASQLAQINQIGGNQMAQINQIQNPAFGPFQVPMTSAILVKK